MKRIVSFLLVLLLTLTLCVTAFAAPVGRKAVCSGPNPVKLLSNANIFPYALRKSAVRTSSRLKFIQKKIEQRKLFYFRSMITYLTMRKSCFVMRRTGN